MRENETGLCVDIKDTKSLYEAVKKLLDDKQLAEKMSANGIKFAKGASIRKFSRKNI